jgi:hypothetical protein
MKALTAYEDTNMYGGAHATNIDVARKAAQEGRDLIVHARHYDGQRYHYSKYRVTDLWIDTDGNVYGITDNGRPWQATAALCNYARTGTI